MAAAAASVRHRTAADFRHEAVSYQTENRFDENLLRRQTSSCLIFQAINHDGGLISVGGNGNYATAPIHHTEPGSGFGVQSDYQTNYGREAPHAGNTGFGGGGGHLDTYNAYQPPPPPPPPPSAGGYAGPSSLSSDSGGYRFVLRSSYLPLI